MQYTVIITAGGIGKRMQSNIPKQFLVLDELPVLMHTISVFHNWDNDAQIIVTLPKDWWFYWEELIQKYNFEIPYTLIAGGIERYDSIKNALVKAKGEYIAVHDGVRPLIDSDTITRVVELAKQKGSAIPVMPLKESLRKGTVNRNSARNRHEYYTVQTPQCFRKEILHDAYQQPFTPNVTDDSYLVEQIGQPIFLVEGSEFNLKITTPVDMKIAELFFSLRKSQ